MFFHAANEERRSSDRRNGHSIEQPGKIRKCGGCVHKKSSRDFASYAGTGRFRPEGFGRRAIIKALARKTRFRNVQK